MALYSMYITHSMPIQLNCILYYCRFFHDEEYIFFVSLSIVFIKIPKNLQ